MTRTLRSSWNAAALSLLVGAGCTASASDTAAVDSELVDPANSNIRSPDVGTVTELRLLPNTNVPRAAIVQLSDEKFVADLYDHVLTVNEAEGLSGADGYAQSINLIVASSAPRYERLLRTIRARHGLGPTDPVRLINPIDGVSDNDLWMQDFGEFAVVRGTNDPSRLWYGLLDANRGRGIDVDRLGTILGIPITKIPTAQSAGTYGGNTEATAEGTLYIGDKVPGQFLAGLKRLGNANAVVLPSDWLLVGHVDEYLTVVPARNRCHSAIMAASGLEALNMARHAPNNFRSVGDVLTTGDVAAELDAYAKTPRRADEDYTLADFDTDRAPANRMQSFIRLNLQAESHVVEAVDRLRAGSCVDQVIHLPQFFTEKRGKAIALNPGTVNSLILRSHAIVPDPGVADLRNVVRRRYAEALGSEENIHFIDDRIYHTADGEVHCGTNVIREITMPYRF
jgi:hypothetical protein